MDIIALINKLGFATIGKDWYAKVEDWRSWYKGNNKDFHRYNVYNGTQFVSCERATLGMAKKVCEDKADLLLNERVEINVGNEQAQAVIDEVLEDNNFWVRGNQLVEVANATGTGAFIEYLDSGRVSIDYVDAGSIYPLRWSNGKIIDCAFASVDVSGGAKTYYISVHTLEGAYVVRNYQFNDEGKQMPLPDGMAAEWNTGSDQPCFQIICPNIANNVEPGYPVGIAAFANSIDVLKAIDLVYDSYRNEFQLGKKRIFVDDSMIKVSHEDGKVKPVFDSRDTVFYGISMGDGAKPIIESDMTIRSVEHETALQTQLDLLSDKCGFGHGYFRAEGMGAKTATEIVSQNSKLYRNVRKDEIVLEKALTDLARAILRLSGVNDNVEISIAFDDSIIEDTAALAARAMVEFTAGIIDSVVYFQQVYGLTEEQALKMAEEIEARKAPGIEFEEGV